MHWLAKFTCTVKINKSSYIGIKISLFPFQLDMIFVYNTPFEKKCNKLLSTTGVIFSYVLSETQNCLIIKSPAISIKTFVV